MQGKDEEFKKFSQEKLSEVVDCFNNKDFTELDNRIFSGKEKKPNTYF